MNSLFVRSRSLFPLEGGREGGRRRSPNVAPRRIWLLSFSSSRIHRPRGRKQIGFPPVPSSTRGGSSPRVFYEWSEVVNDPAASDPPSPRGLSTDFCRSPSFPTSRFLFLSFSQRLFFLLLYRARRQNLILISHFTFSITEDFTEGVSPWIHAASASTCSVSNPSCPPPWPIEKRKAGNSPH